MGIKKSLILFIALMVAGCGGSDKFGIAVVFPDDASRERASGVAIALLVPGASASCAALLDGSASPGDSGYSIEDELSISLPDAKGSRPLEADGDGPRLFFAQAEDGDGLVFLHGCTSAEAGKDGPDEVLINLVPIVIACETDAQCDDSNACTSDACSEGLCENLAVTDGTACDDGAWCTDPDACTAGQCGGPARSCDDADPCTDDLCDEGLDSCDNSPVADPPEIEGPEGDPTCSDGLDNDCDGLTDAADTGCVSCTVAGDCDDQNGCTTDACDTGVCTNDPVADGSACDDGAWCTDPDTCTAGQCGGSLRSCDDSDPCTDDACDEGLDRCDNSPVADPPGVEGPEGDPSCSDGLDNDCDLLTDGADPGCLSCFVDGDCDDLNECTTDACDTGTCTNDPVADGAGCDDLDFCTESDACSAGVCGGTARDCSAADDDCNLGTCDGLAEACIPVPVADGTACDDGLFCTAGDACDAAGQCQAGAGSPCAGDCASGCDEAGDQCQPEPAGTACPDDGITCTLNEQCDGAGNCVGTQDDPTCDALTPGTICEPACFGDASGCGMPPATLDLVCDDPVDLSATDTSACTLSLTGPDAVGQEACLSCSALVGVVEVDHSGFDDGAGACDANGWTLAASAGTNCRSRISGCSEGGGPMSCCDQFASLCDANGFGQPVLVSDLAGNCGGGTEEWRMSKTFDLSGLSAVRLCFDIAEVGASDATGMLVTAEDGANGPNQLFCLNGKSVAGADGLWTTRCVDLPAWSAGSTDTTVTFNVHSEVAGEIVYLDSIRLFGWSGGCAPSGATALDETFTGCDTSGWSFPVGTYTCQSNGCSNEIGWRPGVFADGPSLALGRIVDASALDGQVEVCLKIGSDLAQPTDGLRLLVDTGSGVQTVWEHSGALGLDGECLEVCVGLGPQAANNPNLRLRVEIDGVATIGLYGVSVTGATYCAADPADLSLSSPLVGDGSGNYAFDATDLAGAQLGASVNCGWDPAPGMEARQSIWFQP